MLLSSRIRWSVFSFLGHYRSTETYIVPPREREVRPGVRRWRSYCSISPQHLARYPSLIAFPRVLQPLACIAASILYNRTPRDLVCPPFPSTSLPLPPPVRLSRPVTTSASRDRSALRHSIMVRLIRRRKWAINLQVCHPIVDDSRSIALRNIRIDLSNNDERETRSCDILQ